MTANGKQQKIIACSATDAVAQIREQFGPDATVVDVRKLADGRIEVTCCSHAAPSACGAGLRGDRAPRLQPKVQHQLPGLASWRKASALLPGDVHVLVGAPGVGKSTALCKWLTRAVLLAGQSARVWRLDGRTVNTSELVSVHGEILGVPVERSWRTGATEDLQLVDLPGSVPGELPEVPQGARVHVVLNAAYEIGHLLAQVRTFEPLGIDSLIVAHLDEETRPAKLWDLVLGTNYPIRFVAAGQNVPGEFKEATPAALFAGLANGLLSTTRPLVPA